MKKSISQTDNETVMQSLAEIINTPGLESAQYAEAYYFLDKLTSFSEQYLELYGVPFQSRN